MGIFSFYNMPKPRQFDHQPIYYDPRKEALQKRIHKVKRELGVEAPDYEQFKEEIRGSFIEGTTHLKRSRERGIDMRDRTSRSMRLLLILAVLIFLLWFFFLK